MPSVPPGAPLVTRSLVNLLVPLAAVYALIRIVRDKIGVPVPTWATAVCLTISLPLLVVGQIWFKHWRESRKAVRLGAILPPRWDGKWIGNYDLLLKFQEYDKNGYPGDGVAEKMDEIGGTFDLEVLWDRNFLTSDVDIIKTILATEFNNYVKGEAFQAFMYTVLGTGVFNADGNMWKFHRSMTRPFFSRDRISHFELFDRHAEEAIAKMKERLRTGYAIDFQDLISRFTLDSATEFLFGVSVHSMESDLPYPSNASPTLSSPKKPLTKSEAFAKAFLESQETISARGRLGWIWPWFEIFNDKTSKSMKVVNEFLDPILKEAVEKAKKDTEAGIHKGKNADEVDEDDTLLDHLVRYTSDPVVLHDETLNILIAGRDTTAGSLTFAIYFLSMYPQVLERLRKEILDVVGPSRRPTYDDVRNMKYLRAVINETLRLYPAVPFNVRYAVQDTILPNPDPNGKPFFVPAKTPISYSVFLMQRRTDYWGPDAHEFDPDRFLDERVSKYLTANPFIFLPFNAGPRICLGQQFAYNEMSFFLVRLLQNFSTMSLDVDSQPAHTRPPADWATSPGRKGKEKFFPKSHLTSYAHGGLWVKMGEAESS